MLAELVDQVIGVDTDRGWITVAAFDAHASRVAATGRFPASRDGYRDALVWADAHSRGLRRVPTRSAGSTDRVRCGRRRHDSVLESEVTDATGGDRAGLMPIDGLGGARSNWTGSNASSVGRAEMA